MPNLGTCKPFCKRGHARVGNVDASGHCRSCGRAKKKDLTGPTSTGTFKEFCTFCATTATPRSAWPATTPNACARWLNI